jgi:hypothetical protein
VARLLSAIMREAMAAGVTPETPLLLLTLTHPDFEDGPLRYVADLDPVTSRANPFTPFPFDVTFPDEQEDQVPVPRLMLDNVTLDQVRWAWAMETPPSPLVEVVRKSDPDYVEWWLASVFEIQQVDFSDPITTLATLGLPDLTVQKHLRTSYRSDLYPALGRAAA